MDPKKVVSNAIGPFPDHCMGYGNPPASGFGYVATLKLSTGQVVADMDEGLEGIVSYDRCEANDAYIGQINMLTASSFCGLNGVVWGYDVARADGLADGSVKPLMELERHDGAMVPVMPVEPLLDAAYRLFGRATQRRFNPLPGSMVVCANKSATSRGPTRVWCALALAIAEDRTRDANLFIEDASDTASTGAAPLRDLERNIVLSILRCGRDQGVLYRTIFVGHKELEVGPDAVGCALTCAPYVTLAQQAVPPGRSPAVLTEMTISEWERALGLAPLPPYPAA